VTGFPIHALHRISAHSSAPPVTRSVESVFFLENLHLKIKVSEVVFRKDLYPRLEHSQAKAQEYSENIEHLPAIQVNQHNELIDGFHRLTAHKLANVAEIEVEVIETTSDMHLLELAIKTNASHGLQLSQSDKKDMAIKLYSIGERSADRKKELSKILSVSIDSIQGWVADLDQAEREKRRKLILDLYLKCYTAEEIGEVVGLTTRTAEEEIKLLCSENGSFGKLSKVTFSEPDYAPPIYNVWAFGKKTNETSHFGNTEQRIVDNLLWLFTEPSDIVIDPFGGGGSTLDVCKARGRRCWISDRKPKPGLEDKLRAMDVCTDLPALNKRWSDVSLTYLDPPYWRQAQNEYSDDPEDLANMSLEDFTKSMIDVVKRFADKQSKGAIALIIQPTQWRAEPKGSFADHVFEIIKGVSKVKNITLENRVSCPYSSEQCTPQMVIWAKENKKLLVLSRELIVWSVAK